MGMTGCAWCGVGPEDDCAADCKSRLRTPDKVERIALHLVDALQGARLGWETGTAKPSVLVHGDDVHLYVWQMGEERYEALFATSSGATLAELSMTVDHWSAAAGAIAGIGRRYFS